MTVKIKVSVKYESVPAHSPSEYILVQYEISLSLERARPCVLRRVSCLKSTVQV